MGLTICPHVEVTATYRLSDSEGQVLDESSNDEPLCYLHGTGRLLPALEQALEGAREGERRSVTLTPEQAFGERREELIFEAVKDNLPEGVEIREGMTLTPGGQQGRFSLRVVELTEKGAMLDGNHPYAGKTLTWELQITSLVDKRPTPGDIDIAPIKWVGSSD